MNLNDTVYVRLTKRGEQVLACYHNCEPKKVSRKWQNFQIYDLMNVFGGSIKFWDWSSTPFVKNEIRLTDPCAK